MAELLTNLFLSRLYKFSRSFFLLNELALRTPDSLHVQSHRYWQSLVIAA